MYGAGYKLEKWKKKPWFNILMHTLSIVCATVLGQCLEYLGYLTLARARVSFVINACNSLDWVKIFSVFFAENFIIRLGYRMWAMKRQMMYVHSMMYYLLDNAKLWWKSPTKLDTGLDDCLLICVLSRQMKWIVFCC